MCIVLILSLLEHLHSCSNKFVLAFGYQPPKNRPDGLYVLKLRKNSYGLKDASATFWKECCDTLLSSQYGFVQSEIDPCLFIQKDCILVTYVDDCLCFSRDKKVLDIVVDLLSKDFVVTDEGEVAKYLGVSNDGSSIELRQLYLIERILEVLKVNKANNANSKSTPSVKPLLHRDENGSERKELWNYRFIQGMIQYLAGSNLARINVLGFVIILNYYTRPQ